MSSTSVLSIPRRFTVRFVNFKLSTLPITIVSPKLLSFAALGLLLQGPCNTATTEVNVIDFGSKGNNSWDNKASIKSAIDAVPEYGTLRIPAGDYNSTSGWVIRKAITIQCEPNAVIRLTGAGTFDVSSHFVVESPSRKTYKFAGTIRAGSKAFLISNPSGLRLHEEVLLRLGRDPYDRSQAFYRHFNVITAIRGSIVTFQQPVPEDIPGTAHELVAFDKIIDGLQIRGCTFDYRDDFTGGGPDQTITVEHTKNTLLSGLTGIRISGGLVNIENENMVVENWHVQRSYYRGYGGENVISGWGFTNARYTNIVADQADHCGIYVESQVRGLLIENVSVSKGPRGTTCPGIAVFGGSKNVVIRKYKFTAYVDGANHRALDTAGQGSDYHVFGADISTGTSYFPLTHVSAPLIYKGVKYPITRLFHKRVRLVANLKSADIGLPAGIYKSVSYVLSSRKGITQLYLGTAGGPVVDLLKSTRIDEQSITTLGYQYPFNERVDKRVFVTTETIVPASAVLDIRVEYFSRALK